VGTPRGDHPPYRDGPLSHQTAGPGRSRAGLSSTGNASRRPPMRFGVAEAGDQIQEKSGLGT
jgi:hypothetical protein